MTTTDRGLIATYAKGALLECVVTRVEPVGVHVQLAGDAAVAGFVRRQDWSWSRRVFDLRGSARPEQRLTARVLGNDGGKLLLSRKAAMPDPFPAFRRRHRKGESVVGRVALIAQKSAGVILTLDDGVDGFIPRSEIPDAGLRQDGFGLLAQDRVAACILRFDDKEAVLSVKEHLRRRDEEYAARRGERRAALRYHPSLGVGLESLYWSLQLQELAEPEISPAVRQRVRDVLVVEDSENVSASLEMVFAHLGFACEVAGSVEAARRQLAERRFDLLILDINLPAASGAELVRELRGGSPMVYVFVLTATAANEWARLVRQAGPVSVFQKPTSIARIFRQLDRQIAGVAEAGDDRTQRAGLPAAEAPAPWPARDSRDDRRQRIGELLEGLRVETGADRAAVLSLRPGPVFELVAGNFPELTREVQQSLEFSPVGTVIRERSFSAVGDATKRRGQFRHLLEVLPATSFAGIALGYEDQARYGLFLLGERPEQLRGATQQRLQIAALQVGRHLAEGRFDQVIAENQGLLLTGFLSDSLLHEIKNELQALEDFAAVQLLLSKRHPESLRGLAGEELVELTRATVGVQEVSRRLGELVVLFRNLAGRSPAEQVDLHQTIRRLRETVQPFADDKGVVIDLDLDDDVPELVVNPKLIDQPILNLMINGIEQMALAGGAAPRLAVATAYRPAEDYPVTVTVADTGPGIHFVEREKIFDLFFTTKDKGTGLGLYVSRFFVERFGGRLELRRSIRFSGSELAVEIPRQVVA